MDFSPAAVDVVKRHPEYARLSREGRLRAVVADLSSPPPPPPPPLEDDPSCPDNPAWPGGPPDEGPAGPGGETAAEAAAPRGPSLVAPGLAPHGGAEAALCVFVLSALAPARLDAAVRNLRAALVPGRGTVYVRDYCAGDLAEARLARARGGGSGGDRGGIESASASASTDSAAAAASARANARQPPRRLGPRWYVRGDGTRCRFFEPTELESAFVRRGFCTRQLRVVERVLENRATGTAMARRWVQGVFSLDPDAAPLPHPPAEARPSLAAARAAPGKRPHPADDPGAGGPRATPELPAAPPLPSLPPPPPPPSPLGEAAVRHEAVRRALLSSTLAAGTACVACPSAFLLAAAGRPRGVVVSVSGERDGGGSSGACGCGAAAPGSLRAMLDRASADDDDDSFEPFDIAVAVDDASLLAAAALAQPGPRGRVALLPRPVGYGSSVSVAPPRLVDRARLRSFAGLRPVAASSFERRSLAAVEGRSGAAGGGGAPPSASLLQPDCPALLRGAGWGSGSGRAGGEGRGEGDDDGRRGSRLRV